MTFLCGIPLINTVSNVFGARLNLSIVAQNISIDQ